MRFRVAWGERLVRPVRGGRIGRGWLAAACFITAFLVYAIGFESIVYLWETRGLLPRVIAVPALFVVVFVLPSGLTWLGIVLGVSALDPAPRVRLVPPTLAYAGAGIVAVNVVFLGLGGTDLTRSLSLEFLLVLVFWPSYALMLLSGELLGLGFTPT